MKGLRNVHWHRTIREIWQSLWLVPLLCTFMVTSIVAVWPTRNTIPVCVYGAKPAKSTFNS